MDSFGSESTINGIQHWASWGYVETMSGFKYPAVFSRIDQEGMIDEKSSAIVWTRWSLEWHSLYNEMKKRYCPLMELILPDWVHMIKPRLNRKTRLDMSPALVQKTEVMFGARFMNSWSPISRNSASWTQASFAACAMAFLRKSCSEGVVAASWSSSDLLILQRSGATPSSFTGELPFLMDQRTPAQW